MNDWGVSLAPFLMPVAVIAIVFSFTAVVTWLGYRRKEREAYYRSETLKKIAESQGSGVNATEFLREQERISTRQRREGQKLGGMITLAVGIAMMIFLKPMLARDPDPAAQHAYLVGLIPLFIGVVLLVYAFVLAPKE